MLMMSNVKIKTCKIINTHMVFNNIDLAVKSPNLDICNEF